MMRELDDTSDFLVAVFGAAVSGFFVGAFIGACTILLSWVQ